MKKLEPIDPQIARRLRNRRRVEVGYRNACFTAVIVTLSALIWLLGSLFANGVSAFQATYVELPIAPNAAMIAPGGSVTDDVLRRADYRAVLREALAAEYPDTDASLLYSLLSDSGATNHIRQALLKSPERLITTSIYVLPVSDTVDQFLKGRIDATLPERLRGLSDAQIGAVHQLSNAGALKRGWNKLLFQNPDSRDPEIAGIATALIGSLMIVVISFALAFPVGVGAAIYLEDFAPRGRVRDLVEVNINNLAAVPSLLFGLLGLAVFINFIGLQRSIALVAGLVMALRAFPTIVISTRIALQAVPATIMDGALSLGASRVQAVWTQKLPAAAPGIFTGAILAIAQVLGETAPLLMIGMVAFVTEVPDSVTDPATALPVQIFQWAANPESAWTERTAAAILILLGVLLLVNALSVWMRHRLGQKS